jgi:hypothetical protein
LATVIRLISLNCINLWLTMFIISFTGYDPELYLLAWIIIASVCVLFPVCWSYIDICIRFYQLRVSFKISLPATLHLIETDRDRLVIFICRIMFWYPANVEV